MDYAQVLQWYLTTYHCGATTQAKFDCVLQGIPLFKIKVTDPSNPKYPTKKNLVRNLAVNYKDLRANTNINKLKKFVSIDVETTGLKASDDIIEISAIKWENFRPASVFTSLCKPRNGIPTEATKVNGITDAMVEDAPNFRSLVPELAEFVQGYPLVAHNAPFDLKFLYVWGLDYAGQCDAYDTLELSRKIVRNWNDEKLYSYRLADVCEEKHILFDGAHRSKADALAAGLLFIELIKEKKETMNILSLLNS